MTIEQYIENIAKRYKLGNATEHTFRGELQQLIESIVPGVAATNEPKRQSCGAPDYILTRKEIPIGYIEAKDIGDTDLDGVKKTGNKEQFDRYKASLNNLIFTDYLHFHLFREGSLVTRIAIGEVRDGKVVPLNANFDAFNSLIRNFCHYTGQTIKSPKRLAEMMALKAKLLSDIIEKALTSDQDNQADSTLKEQMIAFKEILIHDITPKGFADVYAQTIAYGMFAARLHDPSLPNFTRSEAAELIPKSNPFLRRLFSYIAGPDLDDRIKWIVDDLVDIFLASNVQEILKTYGRSTKTEDPIIHFYETFLSEYDPKLRKARGVWYTPQPVVNFIVRAVDDILKTEFGLSQGLADTSKIKIKVNQQGKQIEKEVHKVQILDPAAGTGTFLAETIRQIHAKFQGQEGLWSNYVENHLLPRLNGFEILMASYAMAHLKLDLLLTETGYKPTTNQRFKVYLTNSLEEYHADTGTLFANWLSAEANEANQIKRDTPVMVVMGNPPYAVSSSNKNDWINNLISDYKKYLNERKINLDDDYIKFIRYGQYIVNKNETGILAFITNNSFIDGVTHRQMRKSLLQTFDKIFVLNLHGDSRKSEIGQNDEPDQNVFDIMQGVSINIMIKITNKEDNLAQVYHYDLLGSRSQKYDFLQRENLSSIQLNLLNTTKPYYFFVSKDFSSEHKYSSGFSISLLFKESNSGIQTKNDKVAIHFTKNELINIIKDFNSLSVEILKQKYGLSDTSGWSVYKAKEEIMSGKYQETKILYRPFDIRYTIFTGKSGGFIGRSRNSTMKHFLNENCGIIFKRSRILGGTVYWRHIGITNLMCDLNYLGDQSFVFPLYIYHYAKPMSSSNEINDQTTPHIKERTPNLNLEIVALLEKALDTNFSADKVENNTTFSPIDLIDYIFGILYSPTFRKKYGEFLKIDFPRIPYPKDKETFWQFVKLGGELRQIHLLESPVVEKYITRYPVDGTNTVDKIKYENLNVFINENQYFENVPEIAWNFYIGGYQPAQKWLKDRKGRKLEFEDILHYQKIIVALAETDRIMKEIDKIEFE